MKVFATAMFAALSLLLVLAVANQAAAEVTGPYTADANTLHLYHFDEPSGTLFDSGAGTIYDLTDTGGPTGRSGTTTGGYNAAAFADFGSAFNALNSGSGVYHSTTSAIGGGVRGASVAQSNFQATNGAFTIEALVNISDTGGEQVIFSHDGLTNRGGMFRILNGALAVYNGQASSTSTSAPIPTTGDHAFEAGEWFHAAMTYTGEAGANVDFYWTRLDSDATEANFIGGGSIGGDFIAVTQIAGLAGATRSPFRFELKGLIDEVRISDVVRGPDEFLFAAQAVPEPASIAIWSLLGLSAFGYLGYRRSCRKM